MMDSAYSAALYATTYNATETVMHKPTQAKQRTAREWLSSLGLNDDEVDRATRYIALHVRYARSERRILLAGILAVLAAFTSGPILDESIQLGVPAVLVTTVTCLIWTSIVITTVAVALIEWRRRWLDRDLRVRGRFPPFAEKELRTFLMGINVVSVVDPWGNPFRIRM
jgi:hypothetical protein